MPEPGWAARWRLTTRATLDRERSRIRENSVAHSRILTNSATFSDVVSPFFGPVFAPITHGILPNHLMNEIPMTEQPQSEKSIFLAAIEIGSAAEQAAFLDQACAGNQPLRAEVEALLHAHDNPQQLLDYPGTIMPTIDQPPL